MAKKPGVTTIATGYYSRAALNANFEALNNAFDNTVSRDGSTPNTMSADLDMNSKDVINAVTIDAEKLILDGTLMTPSGVDPVFSGTVSAFGASLIDDANASVARTTLGLGTASTTAATDYVAVSGDSMTGNLSFADNGKAAFGAGPDLEIYHDGSNSIIADVGTGHLKLLGNDMRINNADSSHSYFSATNGGSAIAYHNGSAKLATTSTGVTVTGTVAATSYTGDGSNLTGIASSFNSSTSWASVSRSSGTTYTNSLSYPIMFKVTGGVNGYISVTVNGVQIHSMTAAYSNRETVTVIVPPGKTYSFSGSSIQGTWILS